MAVILESSVLILLLIGFRRFCRNLICKRGMYGLWLIVLFRMLPIEFIWGSKVHSFLLEIFSRILSFFPNREYARFDLSAIQIPGYMLALWILGSMLVFLWEFFVNVKFERMLYDQRERISNENCPYPLYCVAGLSSSCVFKVRGETGIYLKKEVPQNVEMYKTILAHEICHLKAGDLFWAKVRLVVMAVFWFNPLVWIAAFFSKEDCEMACDERTIALLGMSKSEYGKILLDAVNTEMLKTKEDSICAATTMITSQKGLRNRITCLTKKRDNKKIQFPIVTVFGLCCLFLSFVGGDNLSGMNEEETIRQYAYYSNKDYQDGMKRLSLYDKWDYFFPNKLEGEILEIRKADNLKGVSCNNYEKELYQVKMKRNYDGNMKQDDYIVSLVKQQEVGDWRIDWRQ